MRNLRFVIVLIFLLGIGILTPSYAAGKYQDRGICLGLYSGYSRGLGWEFAWHNRSSLSDKTTLRFHGGVYARYDFSRFWGLQADLNYQGGRNRWTFSYPGWPQESGADGFGITSLSLEAVVHFLRIKRLRVSALAGGGLNSGQWGEYGGWSSLYAHLRTGLRLRIGLSSRGSRPGFILGATFVHLIDPDEYTTITADYFRFSGGMEFRL